MLGPGCAPWCATRTSGTSAASHSSLGALQQPFMAYLVAYAEQGRGLSVIRATALTTGWIVRRHRGRRALEPHHVASARAGTYRRTPRSCSSAPPERSSSRGRRRWRSASPCNGFASTRLVLAVKSRLIARHPGRVGGAFAVVSTIEFAGFGLPLLAGRVADAYGVRAGLACFVAIAVVLVLVTGAGDQIGARRGHASSARAI